MLFTQDLQREAASIRGQRQEVLLKVLPCCLPPPRIFDVCHSRGAKLLTLVTTAISALAQNSEDIHRIAVPRWEVVASHDADRQKSYSVAQIVKDVRHCLLLLCSICDELGAVVDLCSHCLQHSLRQSSLSDPQR